MLNRERGRPATCLCRSCSIECALHSWLLLKLCAIASERPSNKCNEKDREKDGRLDEKKTSQPEERKSNCVYQMSKTLSVERIVVL